MAEEKEQVTETEETPDTGSTVESASEVTTEPTTEDSQPNVDYVQLEQRVTSLEERLLSVESAPTAEPASTNDGSDPNFEDVTEETQGQDGDSRDEESTEDIKKMLDL